jgi:hypothetical protein
VIARLHVFFRVAANLEHLKRPNGEADRRKDRQAPCILAKFSFWFLQNSISCEIIFVALVARCAKNAIELLVLIA